MSTKCERIFSSAKKLLTPEDDFEALKEFNHELEGTTSTIEAMHLEYQKLLQDYPDLAQRLSNLPGRVFSGKEHPSPGAKAIFFCYSLPSTIAKPGTPAAEEPVWTEEAGYTRWYLYNLDSKEIVEEAERIIALIRSKPETPRHCSIAHDTLSEIRREIEKHIKNTYLKQVQAPVGVRATLKAWMELS